MTTSIVYKYNITEKTTILSSQPVLNKYPNINYSSVLYCHTAEAGKAFTNGESIKYILYTETEAVTDWWEIDDPCPEEE